MDFQNMLKISMTRAQAKCITGGWMTGWLVALLLSSNAVMSFNIAMCLIYGGLTALTVLIVWEHRKYYNNLNNLDYWMARAYWFH